MEIQGKATAILIIAKLNLDAVNHGNTLDLDKLRKRLKEVYGIELKKTTTKEAEQPPIISTMEELKVGKWQEQKKS